MVNAQPPTLVVGHVLAQLSWGDGGLKMQMRKTPEELAMNGICDDRPLSILYNGLE